MYHISVFSFPSSSCVDRSQPPLSNQNPFQISAKRQWILCRNWAQHGDSVIFLHVLNVLVCNIIWFLVTLIFAAFINNLQWLIGQHVTPGSLAEFTDQVRREYGSRRTFCNEVDKFVFSLFGGLWVTLISCFSIICCSPVYTSSPFLAESKQLYGLWRIPI